MSNPEQFTVTASFVLGGWRRDVDGRYDLLDAIMDGCEKSPLAEVTVRLGPPDTSPVTTEAAKIASRKEVTDVYAEGVAAGLALCPTRACPCLHTTPCHPYCTCAVRTSSRGCLRCCTYGSRDQQRQMAEHLASAEPFAHLASGLKKVLPPALLADVLEYLDPLPRFLAALREP